MQEAGLLKLSTWQAVSKRWFFLRSACVPLNVTCRLYRWKLKKVPVVHPGICGLQKSNEQAMEWERLCWFGFWVFYWFLFALLTHFSLWHQAGHRKSSRNPAFSSQGKLLYKGLSEDTWHGSDPESMTYVELYKAYDSIQKHMQHIVTTSSWWFQPTSSTTKQPRGKDPFPWVSRAYKVPDNLDLVVRSHRCRYLKPTTTT